MIAVEALSFRHSPVSNVLFENLSFTLQKGQTLALLGRNGRGKTTLLKCMAGLLAPSSGVVRCAGAVGYVPQQFAAPFDYSVRDVVLMGRARHIGMFSSPSADDRQHAEDAIGMVGLDSLADRAIGSLSGGERQLALIARALASEADIVLLDEPAAALDFRNQALMLALLQRLSRERGLTIVMTTHEPTHALEIADRAVLLHGAGRHQEGSMAEVCTEVGLTALYGIPMRRLDRQDGGDAGAHVVADFGFFKQDRHGRANIRQPAESG